MGHSGIQHHCDGSVRARVRQAAATTRRRKAMKRRERSTFTSHGQLRGESDTARRLLVTLHSICPRPILFMDDDPSDALDSQDSGVTVIQRYGRNSLRRCLFAETRGEQDASAHRLFTASEKTRASWDASKVRYHYPNSTDPRPKFSSAGAACCARSWLRTNSTPAVLDRFVNWN